jgi:hypothetical protein
VGRWIKSHSKYTLEDGTELYASNGQCSLCLGGEIETVEHVFKCESLSNIHIDFANKLRTAFGNQPGWEFIEWHLTNDLRHELAFKSTF